MNICKAIILEGKNKGNNCGKNTTNDHGYCGKHLRNKKYDEGLKNSVRWCRLFFRGCDNEITNEPENVLTCKECVDAKKKHIKNCQHDGCKYKAQKDALFCGKHERDKYRLEEIEKGIRYCDIDRGCFTICNEGMASCKQCLENSREKENTLINNRKEINKQLQCISDKRLCQKCGNEFEVFKTAHDKHSTKCKKCFEIQKNIETNRNDRNRNFKEEKKQFLETYFSNFINAASKKGRTVELNFEDYKNLVTKNCYYCGYYNENEAIGIDRVNNSLHYTKENIVPCCEICNRIKSFYHPLFFINKIKIICNILKPDQEFYKKWEIYYSRSIPNNYLNYKNSAEKRNLKFNITSIQWEKLIRQPCYLCGYSQVVGIGLDRFDNTIREYNIENCKPCCGSCNFMKNEMNYTDFMDHLNKIAIKWNNTSEFEKIPSIDNPYKRNSNVENKKERTHWKRNGLYQAILANKCDEFITKYNNYLETNEFESICKEVYDKNDKDIALNKLGTFLNTLNMRRKRSIS
jgi:hypothetical protein